MASTVSDVMTRNPVTIESSEPVREAARRMRNADAGDVIVARDGRPVGIVTDRDIVVRVVAEDRSLDTPVQEVLSGDLTAVAPDTSLDQAVQVMRSRAIRRLPVVEDDRVVGVVSLGDLAIERDSESALADVSAARGNT